MTAPLVPQIDLDRQALAATLRPTASIGAIWSVCAPDMAAPAVIDRFKQIEPKVLIACDAVTYAGKRDDRRDVIDELKRALPTVAHFIRHSEPATDGNPRLAD